MGEKQKFVCSFCGAEYDTARARARCELECDEKRRQEKTRVERKRLMVEKQSRLAEVNKAFDNYVAVVKQFNKDYHEFPKAYDTFFVGDMPATLWKWLTT